MSKVDNLNTLNSQQKIDFLSNLTSEELNDLDHKIYSDLDNQSLQYLLDKGIAAEKLASKTLKAMGANYQEALKTNLQFLLSKGLDLLQLPDLSSLDLGIIYNHREVLASIMLASDFLKLALRAKGYGSTWDHITRKWESDSLRMHGELLKCALDKGADINGIVDGNDFYNLDLRLGFLATHKEFLFNLAKHITPTNFLKMIVKVNATSEADIALQGELLKEVLDKAVDINWVC